jgi:hypothetical protein
MLARQHRFTTYSYNTLRIVIKYLKRRESGPAATPGSAAVPMVATTASLPLAAV